MLLEPATMEEAEGKAVAAFQEAQAALQSGDAEAALTSFMRAATLLPGWPDAWAGLGMCLHRLRHYQHACAVMHRALELCGFDNPELVLTFMDSLRELGRADDIVKCLDRVPEGPFAHFAALLVGGAVQARDGPAAAAPHYEAAMRAEPECLLYRYLAAQAVGGQGLPPFCATAAAQLPGADGEEQEEERLLRQLHRAQHHLDAPSLWRLNDKVELHRLITANRGTGEGAPPSSFWPPSFVLPGERAAAEEVELCLHSRAAKTTSAQAEDGASGPIAPRWVRKQPGGMGGLGVTVHATVADALSAKSLGGTGGGAAAKSALGLGDAADREEWLLQRYIEPPVLVRGRRFSLRLFLVLYLGHPLTEPVAYLAREGLMLSAAKPYTADVAADRCSHITNQSASQLLAPEEELTRAVGDVDASELLGWPCGWEGIWRSVEVATRGLMEACRAALTTAVGQYCPTKAALVPKVLGLDFILSAEAPDQPAAAWLLEVNRHPSLGERYPCARKVKRTVVFDAWRLLLEATAAGQVGDRTLVDSGVSAAADGPAWPQASGCLRRIC